MSQSHEPTEPALPDGGDNDAVPENALGDIPGDPTTVIDLGPDEASASSDYWRPGIRLDTRVIPSTAPPPEPPPRRTGLMVAAILAVALILCVLVLLVASWLQDDTVSSSMAAVAGAIQIVRP